MIKYFIVVWLLTCLTLQADLKLNLQQTEAILYANNQVALKFKCEGCVGEIKFEFLGIPSNWIKNKNDLVISNFSVGERQQWNFQVYVVDNEKNYLRQTIKLIFLGFNVQLVPVTLPETGNYDLEKQKNTPKNDSFNINSLIQQYPGLQDSDISPHVIANSQAEYDPKRDSRNISAYEVRKKAALQRQLNANKAISNLLEVIEKLTENVRNAFSSIKIYEKKVEEAKKGVKSCQDQQFSLENVRAKILNAVNDKKAKMNQYDVQISENEKKLKALQVSLSKYKRDRFEIEKKNAPNNIQLQRLESTLSQCDNILSEDKLKIQNIINQINMNNAEISILETQISESKSRVRELTRDLSLIRKKIADLKKELLEAEDKEKEIAKEHAYYKQIPIEGEKKINLLKIKNTEFYRQISSVNASIKSRINECEEVKKRLNELRNKLALSKFNYQTLAKLIDDKEKEIKDVKEVADFFRQNSVKIPIQIATLEVQLNKYEERIRRQKYLCNVAEEDLQRAQTNFKSISEKYERDRSTLREVNKELQKARVEKELSDLAVEEILSQTTQVTPFPTQQAANPTTFPTVQTLGNNFQISVVSDRRNAVNVSNLNEYISKSFRLTTQQDKGSILYPLNNEDRKKLVSSVTKSAGLSLFPCQNQRRSYVGTITKVSLGTINVKDRRNRGYTLSLSDCTTISATRPDNFFERGTRVYFSGNQVFELPGNILFDAYEILLIPN